MKRLRQLEQENAKLVAERDLEIDVMKGVARNKKQMVSASVRRKQVTYVRQRGVSLRRVCALLQVARSAMEYQSRLADRDAPVLAAMRELAAQYPRFGYRRIQVFVVRRGFEMSADRAYRLRKQAGLQVPRRRSRRRVATGRPRPLPATGANEVWAYDFVFDACANGQQLKCLTVIDEFTRECLAIDVAESIRRAARDRGVFETNERAWRVKASPIPQRSGVRFARGPALVAASGHRYRSRHC